jgi:hypothetical protein
MFSLVRNIDLATRFDRGNANRAAAAYVRRTGGQAPTVEPCGDAFVIRQNNAYLRAI